MHSTAVDYAKSGHEARLPPKLKPKQWPHFMEKQGSRPYHSNKALGKLYDKVELVDFVPVYDEPFDSRILDAYIIDDSTLLAAAKIKEIYDADVCRIMSQHDIKTEFEVWSTFVLHHTRTGSDYKFHEEIGRLSTALKDKSREMCHKEAGGREYEKLAPFVAAMYKITSMQVSGALEKHKAELQSSGNTDYIPVSVDSMPKMSFPWLFPAVLGEIAMGRAGQRFSQPLAAPGPILPRTWQRSQQPDVPESVVAREEDVLQTRSGLTHRGEILSLFTDNEAKPANAEDVIRVQGDDSPHQSLSSGSSSPERRLENGPSKSEMPGKSNDHSGHGLENAQPQTKAYDGSDDHSEASNEEEGEITLPLGTSSLLSQLREMQES